MSISSWITLLEIHDLENSDYKILPTTSFFNYAYGTFSYVFQVLEKKINNVNIYFCVYILNMDIPNGEETNIEIKKFIFPNFIGNIEEQKKITISHSSYVRITSSIIYDYYDIITVFLIKSDVFFPTYYNFYVLFYDYDLNEIQNIFFGLEIIIPNEFKNGFFFKVCYLYNKYSSLITFLDSNRFQFRILSLDKSDDGQYSFSDKISWLNRDLVLNPDITLNEFLKIDNNRLVFLSTINYEKLSIIFFDLYKNFEFMKVRYYSYDFKNEQILKFSKEISAFIYNGFLTFSGTVLPKEINDNGDNFFSIFLMFSYPNGTDSEINMFPYLMDSGYYDTSKNLFNDLMENMTIENNIFGYEKLDNIKLVYRPEELIFLDASDDTEVLSGGILKSNYKLYQNKDLKKSNKYYYVEYQFIIREPDHSSFYHVGNVIYWAGHYGNDDDLNEYYEPKIYYGRTNTLKFKLCHNYCQTCKEIGKSFLDQKCESCIEQYSYSNLYQLSLCVEKGYFIDIENESIEKCTLENSKNYIDLNSNKTICFKNNYDCPSEYNNYNEETKECKSYNPTTSINNIIVENEKTEYIEEDIGSTQNLLKNNSYSNLNNTNYEINKIIDDLLINYNITDKSIEIKGENNSIFQLTTSENEFKKFNGNLNNGLSIIVLGDCETLLKQENGLKENDTLIIKKYEKLTISAERNVQYEVYHPITKMKLNLSICNYEKVDLYIPVELDDKLINLYEDLKDSGYDLFNIEDPFYNDICSPYESENGTDVLLSDRKNDFYNNNNTTCQANCQYSSFDSKYKFLKCNCSVIIDDIDIKHFGKFSKTIYKNFYDILKNSNYKTLKCYKLIFNSDNFKMNIGSFVIIFFFIGYSTLFIIYIIKGISPLQKEAINTVCNKFKDVNINSLEKYLNDKKSDEKINDFPPKKRKTEKENKMMIGDENNKKIKYKRRKKSKTTKKSRKLNNSSKINYNDIIITGKNKELIKNNGFNTIEKIIMSKEKININELDDLDLNNLVYEKALDLDKRNFSQIYWSKLKKKHLIIHTFFSHNDHNLIYIKITRFIFLICTNMAMNVIFFFDSSMHKIYLDYGKYNFIPQIPQIIYSSIVSLTIETLIGILSSTDNNIYQIKQIEEYNPKIIKKVINKIKIKLIIFFIITFIFFGFYWYLISSFCAVYNNTQIIYLKDFITSFCFGLLYPFAIQLCFTLLRIFSLKKKSKSRSLIYKFC